MALTPALRGIPQTYPVHNVPARHDATALSVRYT
jgi:hypothetical protein